MSRRIALICLVLAAIGTSQIPITPRRVVIVIAPRDFRDEELMIPLEYLRKQKVEVQVASQQTADAVGMLGLHVVPDLELASIDPGEFDGIILVGGSGAVTLWPDTMLHRVVRSFADEKKPIGAICLAPAILARAGVLKGVKATVFLSARDELLKGGALVSKRDVEVSVNIITASGPRVSAAFVKAFYRRLVK